MKFKRLAVALSVTCIAGSDVAFASTNFGSAEALVSEAAIDGAAHDVKPNVATDGQGIWIATWPQYPGGTLGITIDAAPVFTRSVDNGATWAPLALIRPDAQDHRASYPNLAANGSGKWIIVYGASAEELRLTVSDDDGENWNAPVSLITSSAGRQNLFASIDTDRAGTWVAAWGSDDSLGGSIGEDGDVLFSRSIDDGLTWSAPAPLNSSASGDTWSDSHVRIATDHDGTWVAVWSTFAQAWYARSTDNGSSWSAPVALSHVGGNGVADPDIAADGSGRWVAVWAVSPDAAHNYGDRDIWFSYSSDNGSTWSAETVLHTYMDDDGDDDAIPRVATSGDGRWTVTWSSLGKLRGTIGDDFDVLISASRDGGVSWSSPAALVTRARLDGDSVDYFSAMASSPTGDASVVWVSDDSLGGTIGNDQDILFAMAHQNCPGVARNDCSTADAAKGSNLKLQDKSGGADRFNWRWRSSAETSEAELGDPTSTDSYVLCLYEKVDAAPGLIGEWDASAGGTCDGAPCWDTSPGSRTYRDTKQTAGAVKKLSVKAREGGGTKIRMQASGPALAPPRLPFDVTVPVRVQLVNLGTNVCWEGVHDQADTNDSTQFKSFSD